MGRKYSLYNALPVIVFLLLGAPTVLVFTGNAEPYVSTSEIPVHPGVAFVGVICSVFVTAFISGVLIDRSFAKAGRSLGLSEEGGGFFGGHPDFVGTVSGRPVRVDTRTVRSASGAEGRSTSTTYTRVAAELGRPLVDGFVLVDREGNAEPRATRGVPDEIQTVPVVDGFSVIGAANESRARDVLTPVVRETLRESGAPDGVIVGDPAETIIDALPDEMAAFGSLLGGDGLEEKLRQEIGGDAPTVSHEIVGLPLDADRLESRLEAMIAVADAVDAAELEPEAAEAGRAA